MVVDNDKKLAQRTYPAFAEGYKLLECVGRGSEGSVWRALCIPIKKEVAIKIIDLECLPVESLDDVRQQIHLMYSCSMNPHIVRYYTSFVHGLSLWCVMKYLAGGSLTDIMRIGHPQGLDEQSIKIIIKDVLKALDYFHDNGRIHRDIKAGNIVISETGRVQVADFGVSGSLVEQLRTTLCGSPCWMAPEVMKRAFKDAQTEDDGYDYAVDIWSLGITALELAKGRPPLYDHAPSRVFSMVVSNPPPVLDDANKKKFSQQFKDFVSHCLQKDPTKRPSAAKLLKHKWFKGKKSREYLVHNVLGDAPSLGERRVEIAQTPPVVKQFGPQEGMNWDFGDNECRGSLEFANSYESSQYLSSSGQGLSLGGSSSMLSDGSYCDTSIFDEWFAAPTPANTMTGNDDMTDFFEDFGTIVRNGEILVGNDE